MNAITYTAAARAFLTAAILFVLVATLHLFHVIDAILPTVAGVATALCLLLMIGAVGNDAPRG